MMGVRDCVRSYFQEQRRYVFVTRDSPHMISMEQRYTWRRHAAIKDNECQTTRPNDFTVFHPAELENVLIFGNKEKDIGACKMYDLFSGVGRLNVLQNEQSASNSDILETIYTELHSVTDSSPYKLQAFHQNRQGAVLPTTV